MRKVSRAYVGGGIVCTVLIVWSVFHLDFNEFINVPSLASGWVAVGTLSIVYVSLPIRAAQWQWLLGVSTSVEFWPALKAICAGHLGNFMLPARGGELVRAYMLSRSSRHTVSRILPSVGLSRLQDLPPILVLLLVALAFAAPLDFSNAAMGNEQPAHETIPLTVLLARLTAVVLVLSALLGLAYVYRDLALALSSRFARRFVPRFHARIKNISGDLTAGLAIVGDWKRFWGAQALSFVCWALFAVSPIPLLLSFGFTLQQSVLIGIVQTAVTSLTFVLPSTPGAIGTFHALCLVSIYACVPDVDPSIALAYTVIIHLVGTLGPALPGLVVLPFEFRGIRDAFQSARTADSSPPVTPADMPD